MKKQVLKVVLLTESRLVNRTIARALDPQLFQILTLNSGTPDIMEQLVELVPDFVFLNTVLKGADGFALCDQIKSNPQLSHIKIIFLSSNPEDAREEAINRRATRFLPIPFSPDGLIHAMEGLVEKKKTILYVDDSKYFHKIIVPPLREQGYEVLPAWNGKEAHDIVAKEHVDLVLTDIEMPVMDGFSLCKSLKQENGMPEIPVIILSSLNSEEEVQKGFDAGADDYLAKPVVLAELFARIRHMLYKDSLKRPERILVVDDARSSRHFICQILRRQGFQTDEAVDGNEAVQKISERKYHLVVTDYEMPGLNGYELCLYLRKHEATSDIPIIMVSARESKADIVKVRSTGVQSYITKPFRADRLLAETERVLVESRLQRERETMRHYISGEVIDAADRYWAANSSHASEALVVDKYCTILIADIVDFQSVYESCSARDAVRVLNAYFEKMVEILTRHKGTVDRFMDESLISLFGDEEKGAHFALSAAQEILFAVPGLQKETEKDLSLRIGIHSGHVIVGDVGSRVDRRDFTVVGNNVKIARRIEEMALPGSMLVSETTLELVKESVTAELFEALTHKSNGKPSLLKTFRVKSVQMCDAASYAL